MSLQAADMVTAVGIDLVDAARVRRVLERFGDRFVRRLLGPEEQQQLAVRRDRAAYVAGRFAAKEAAIKALGRYLTERPSWRELQVVNERDGTPRLRWGASLSARLGHLTPLLSISHEKSHAVAIVLLMEPS